MKTLTVVLAVAGFLAPLSTAHSQRTNHSFSVQAGSIGSPSGEVTLTGGGMYDSPSGSLHGGGSFRCTQDVNQGPFAGLKAGEGARWEAAEILPSSGFKCGGVAGEPLKTAVTDDDTVVMVARFFRQGDGATPSFTAKIFISAVDENPDQPGAQNVWIQGIGCGEAYVNLR